MENYNGLLRDILDNGIDKVDRTGIGTRSLFGRTLRFDLSEGFPIITTRKVSFRIAFEETMMFLRGITDTRVLEEKNITIWKGNTSREFLDNAGLQHLPVGSLGTGYSHAWRNFGGIPGQTDGVDQIRNLITTLQNDPNGRRHIVTGWNPTQLSGTPLPPCHLYQQYAVNDGKLDSTFIMRSWDVYHGGPYNIMGYSFLNMAFAKILGLEPGEVVAYGVDVHIYHHQYDVVKMQLAREPKELPKLVFKKDFGTLDELLELEFEDIEIVGYDPHPPLPKVNMAV